MASSMTDLTTDTPEYMLLPKVKFKLSLEEFKNDAILKEALLDAIKRNSMTKYYEKVCREFEWEMNESVRDEMQSANTAAWDALECAPHEANPEDHARGNWRERLEFACSIGDIEKATSIATLVLADESASTSIKAEAVFALFRIAYFKIRISGMRSAIELATDIIETAGCSSGGDWCCRNKLKIYEAIYCLATRNYERATSLLLDCVSTFESHELLPFHDVVRYAVLACMIVLPRSQLNEKLNEHGILLQTLAVECPRYRDYLRSLYDCHYAEFFVNLGWVESEMRQDPLLHPHYRHYIREMRIRAYSQLLQAYRTLSLERMAMEFGVATSYIEQEIARFVVNGRLRCKIDKVSESIVTVSAAGCDAGRAPDACCDRGLMYQTAIKKGDLLLNHFKNLARVIDF